MKKPAEWSEEDEMLMDELESYILYDKEFNDEQKARRIKRLNELRPQWKPSEEQIHATIEALKYLPNNKDEWRILNTLVDVFKKLM